MEVESTTTETNEAGTEVKDAPKDDVKTSKGESDEPSKSGELNLDDIANWTDDQLKDYGKVKKTSDPDEATDQKTEKPKDEAKSDKLAKTEPVKSLPYIPDVSKQVEALKARQAEVQKRLAELDGIDPADKLVNDPKGFMDAMSEKPELKSELKDLKGREEALQKAQWLSQNRGTVLNRYPKIMEMMPSIVQAAMEGGEKAHDIEQLQANPFAFNPATVLYYATKAELAEAKKVHAAEIDKIKKEHAKAMESVQGMGRTPITNNGNGEKAIDFSKIKEQDVSNMDTDALKEFYKQISGSRR